MYVGMAAVITKYVSGNAIVKNVSEKGFLKKSVKVVGYCFVAI